MSVSKYNVYPSPFSSIQYTSGQVCFSYASTGVLYFPSVSSLFLGPYRDLCFVPIGLRRATVIAISCCGWSSPKNGRWMMSTDLTLQAGQGKLLLLLLLESVRDSHSELAPDPLSSWPIFLKELTRAAFLDSWSRSIDRDTPILLIQAHVSRCV